ncbi:hypothetical protein BGI32_01390 [Snodgrassella alvi]|uniref:DUF305 domain-containing protein n=2 Tax=Snodgrassella alvi TaxID=1196083 RepID=A0A2N9WWB0_9NEIS|nr:hypothetical protein BGI32_01390 [Snodgrassella alvi]
MKKVILVIAATLGLFISLEVAAQDKNNIQHAYMQAMNKMHKPMMDAALIKDADISFVKGMIAHHQGAIDMAKIELKYGKDPELKVLAQNIIKAQQQEIAFMQQWLQKHTHKK